jgi:hypothetical protein
LEGSDDFENVFKEMEEHNICRGNSLLYELYAGFLEAKENWKEAYMVYQTGILRLLPLVFCCLSWWTFLHVSLSLILGG